MNIDLFPHKIILNVRFSEVDMLGVCNNASYINYFEHARLQYLKAAGLIPEAGIFSDGNIYFIVRNECDYKSYAFYDDELAIYTRISFIKNSSYGFEHIVINNKNNKVVAEGKGVIARVDPKTNKSMPLGIDFINNIKNFDNNVEIIGNENYNL